MSETKIVKYWNEKWVPIEFEVENPPRYEVSNYGRLCSYQNGEKEGTIIKGSVIQGYRSLNIRIPGGKTINRYVHKLVADIFVKRESESHKFVIHLDFDKQNNRADNLKWVTKEQMIEHNRKNPAVINRKIPTRTRNYKLTEMKVRMIKKMLKSEKSRLKMIAKQFGITHTQLNRIRSGENWKHVTVDDE
ncbi:HNH endonuclease [Runella sp. MFBS21]|uniref:HNH endonuclease n=1 Tax=Runella TaxID=105 RepID=UPI0003FD6AB1|nr:MULTISPECIES: HNH endonuclease [Runella]MDF7821751.1 HNH endonuclease [Runella sp. MFBS21]